MLDREEVAPLPPLEESCSFIRDLRKATVAEVLRDANKTRSVAVQPRSGVGGHEDMLRLLTQIEDEAAPDILTLTIDSYTRLRRFDQAARIMRVDPTTLNGYPLVAHGWLRGREINLRTKSPLDVRHGTPVANELFDIAIASGITSFEGGGLTYNLPYAKNIPLADSLSAWRRIDRTCGELAMMDVVVAREMFGTLTAVLIPPSICLAITLLEAISAAQEGVRCISIAYPQGGNVVQDVAAVRCIGVLGNRYLPSHVDLYPVLHQFMGPFPRERARASSLIMLGGIVAKLGGAAKVVTKTFDEAHGIPTVEANVEGIMMTKCALSSLFDGLVPKEEDIVEEMYWIEREVAELIEPVLNQAVLDRSIIQAFADGRLDVPFCPSIAARSELMPVRDGSGAIRYLSTGRLPFSRKTRRRNDDLLRVSGDTRVQIRRIIESIDYFLDGSSAYSQRASSDVPQD